MGGNSDCRGAGGGVRGLPVSLLLAEATRVASSTAATSSSDGYGEATGTLSSAEDPLLHSDSVGWPPGMGNRLEHGACGGGDAERDDAS